MADGSSLHAPRPEPSAAADPWFVEEGRFKDALSLWATGVAVATCQVDGQPQGLTVSSFTSLSVKPPRVLFCIAKSARCSPAFRAADEVALSLLAEEHDGVARRLSGRVPAGDRFPPTDWDLPPDAPPVLRRSLARFRGCVRSRLDGGSHDVLIVDVRAVEFGSGRPLLYAERRYARLAALNAAEVDRPLS